jgi:hypothetical protein
MHMRIPEISPFSGQREMPEVLKITPCLEEYQ